MHTTITKLTGKISPAIFLNLYKKDPQNIDIHTSYTYPYPNIYNPTHRPPPLQLKPFRAAWNPNSFIYTDEFQKNGEPHIRGIHR
jgi:hypothetical protein